ncbi:hypothetical protein [Azospirillum largimobile]
MIRATGERSAPATCFRKRATCPGMAGRGDWQRESPRVTQGRQWAAGME